ncbi:hypothetical protein D5086_000334 [Populus alba]|uniref:Uncharacterized protein n=1 Tax=Populus alba TaxID=43335 RepID=A0ACC4CW30_POPAL
MSANTAESNLFPYLVCIIDPPPLAFLYINKELFTKSMFLDHKSLVQARIIRHDISRIKKIRASRFEPQDYPTDYDVPYFGSYVAGSFLYLSDKSGGWRRHQRDDLARRADMAPEVRWLASDESSTLTSAVMLDRMVFGCSQEDDNVDQKEEGSQESWVLINRGEHSLVSQVNALNFTPICVYFHSIIVIR